MKMNRFGTLILNWFYDSRSDKSARPLSFWERAGVRVLMTRRTRAIVIIGILVIAACIAAPVSGVSTDTSPNERLLKAVEETGAVTQVKALLEQGADADAKSRIGVTALMAAAGLNHLDIVKLLVENGADVNVRDNNGDSALRLTDNLEIFRYLKARVTY